jgi:NADH-quinone oxidoreductase subunit F
MVFDETVSVVRAVSRWIEFYKHESCGKCTPCREGTGWMVGLLEKFEHGEGKHSDLDLLHDISSQIAGRSFCALGDAAATPFPSAMKYFKDEFEQAETVAPHTIFPIEKSQKFETVSVS